MIKSLILFASCLFTLATIQAQTVNDIPIDEIEVDYMQIIGTSKFLSNKVTIQIDFGQRKKFWSSSKGGVLKDERGRPIVFNSMIDALNFMSENGFEFENAFAITVGSQNVYHYMLKRKEDK